MPPYEHRRVTPPAAIMGDDLAGMGMTQIRLQLPICAFLACL